MAQTNSCHESSLWIAGALLAVAPIASFVTQYMLSAGPENLLFRNPTVAYVDWVFVPFNLFVVHLIDWSRGGRLFVVMAVAVTANTAAHAFWQIDHQDPGHMIAPDGVFLPAGWVHLIYSTMQMILIGAFIFVRRREAPFGRVTSALAVAYFMGAGVCGYLIHHGVMITDAMMVLTGLALVLVYPHRRESRRRKALSRAPEVSRVP
ncbi:MAG: hypothetical protein JSS27_08875 [Planctomycetes bacterium]|nr:hypothetical protein [Planctomycetota bacterium]